MLAPMPAHACVHSLTLRGVHRIAVPEEDRWHARAHVTTFSLGFQNLACFSCIGRFNKQRSLKHLVT